MEPTLGERVGIGRGAEVFAWGEGRVLKLLREPQNRPWLEHEFASQRSAVSAGIRAPEVFEIVEHDGRPGIVMERIDGPDGLTLLNRKPWLVWKVGALVGRLHRQLSGVPAPPESLSLRETVRHDISTSPKVPEAARQRLLAILEGLPEGDRLCHMDFHPANVIIGEDGPVVIDFASARRAEPIADHVKSLMLFDAGSPPEMGLWERLLLLFGRRLARAGYTRGYGKLSAEDSRHARQWRPVIVGQRLAEGIPEERTKLLQLLSRSLRDAERA